ncbi:hypothetical protein [Streptomyces sp. NPDC029004]|uniref:hypothetical protein n=1 Tax=Streptomyces sp. NPDC029004 TaxID=3154490 RepID=UPI00340E95CE
MLRTVPEAPAASPRDDQAAESSQTGLVRSSGGCPEARKITPDPAYADTFYSYTFYSYTAYATTVPSGSTSTLTVSAGNAFPAGKHLRLRLRAYDGTAFSSWSGYTTLVMNTDKPAAPSIACTPYAQDTWTAKAAEGAQCTLDTSSADGQGYLWGLNDPNTPNRTDDTADGNGGDPLTITVNPAEGWHTLYAKTIDSGGNLSTTATSYTFGVGADGAALLAPGDRWWGWSAPRPWRPSAGSRRARPGTASRDGPSCKWRRSGRRGSTRLAGAAHQPSPAYPSPGPWCRYWPTAARPAPPTRHQPPTPDARTGPGQSRRCAPR